MIYEDADRLTAGTAEDSESQPTVVARAMRSAGPHIAAVALLASLLAVFFWPLTVEGEVLSPADWIYVSHPWAADPPEDFDGPQNANQGDDAFISFPRRTAFYGDEGGSWWQDDYLAGGRSTFSVDHLGLNFYPPSWVYHVMSFDVANGVFHAGVLLFAGVAMYALLRQLKLPWLAAVYGGMLFMLNGHFVVWLGAFSLPAILGLVPFMLFGFERHRETRAPIWLLIPAACLAIQIYIAYVPGWVTTGVVLTLYGAVRLAPGLWRREWRQSAGQTAAYAVPVVVGVLLAAYAFIPSVASALASEYQGERELGLKHIGLENAWTFFFPDYWGGPGEPGGRFLARDGDYPGIIAYFGITAVPLAVVGLWKTRGTWVFWFVIALLVFSVSQLYGIQPLKSLAHLPGLQQTHVLRWNFGIVLSMSLLAPFGLALLLDGARDKRERLSLAAAVAGVLAIAGIATLALVLDRDDTPMLRTITDGHGAILHPSEVLDLEIFAHFHAQVWFLLGASVLTIAALLTRRRVAQALAGGLVAITFLDLFVFGAGYNATLDPDDLYPETPGIEFLRADPDLFRIAPVGAWLDPFPGYTPNVFALDTIGGYDHFRDEDYQRFIDPMQSPADNANYEGPAYVTIGSDRWPLNENLLALLNVKYIATPPNGLFYNVVGESRINTAVGVYDDVTQGQGFDSGGEQIDAFEFFLGTGGELSGPDTPVTFELRESERDREAIHSWVIDGQSIRDNQWFRIDLPEEVDTTEYERLYIEISAPRLPREQALFVWTATDESLPGGQRFESGEEAAGTLTFRALRSPGSWVSPEYEGDDLVIYRLNDTLPRAWGVGEAEVLPNGDAVLDRVASEEFDPGRAVALEADDADPGLPEAGQRAEFSSEITDYDPDSMAVRTDFSDDGFLVVSIPHDDAWQATVDGEDVDILPANGLLQAVPVGAGEHEVELEFRPAEYVWGQRISIVTVITLLVGGMAYAGYSQRRRLRRTGEDQTSS